MNTNQVVVHEVDGRRMHMVFEGFADGTAPPGTEPAELGPVGVPGRLTVLPSLAHRRAAALLAVYRSHVDFLKDCEIENGTESLRHRFKKKPLHRVAVLQQKD